MNFKMNSFFLLAFLFLSLSSIPTLAKNFTSIKELQTSRNINTVTPASTSILTKSKENVMNPIDSCWQLKPDWETNRKFLADCAVGFGQNAIGGRDGEIYIVTDESDDAVEPKIGTLRYAATRKESLWIVFEKNMIITLEKELMINSHKTIDGRGVRVEITKGPCIGIEHVKHVIIHGIYIHECRRRESTHGSIQITPGLRDHRRDCGRNKDECGGDGINVKNSSNIWIDHCYLSNCTDGLIDVNYASQNVTISNSRFTHHDKVILLGHDDKYREDKVLKVTIAFNHFGPGLIQRMPRLRYGYVHVVNNNYEPWLKYAIGGSCNPTILSEANSFRASDDSWHKEVTKRLNPKQGWKNWNWTSKGDMFLNGAKFVSSGVGNIHPTYTPTQKFAVAEASLVPAMTFGAGPLPNCVPNRPC